MDSGTRGVVYVAWGESFIKEAAKSVISLKKHMHCSATLIKEGELPTSCESLPFDKFITVNFTHTYRDKILMSLSPYDETIFLDTDTFVLGDLGQIFELLNRFDVAYQQSGPSDHYSLPGVPMHAFDEPSAGIIAWRKNERTTRFFELWDEEYSNQERANGNGAWDQRSMRAALWNSDVTIAPLNRDWQLYSFEFGIVIGNVKMVHGRGKDAKAAIDQCNRVVGPRLYAPRLGVMPAWEINPLDYLRLSVKSFRMFLHRAVRLGLHWVRVWKLPENKRPM